jgi:hypothetical protein
MGASPPRGGPDREGAGVAAARKLVRQQRPAVRRREVSGHPRGEARPTPVVVVEDQPHHDLALGLRLHRVSVRENLAGIGHVRS